MSAVKTHLGRKPSPPPILPKYSSLQSKRELFFKNELPSGSVNSVNDNPVPVCASTPLKDPLNKRQHEVESSRVHESNIGDTFDRFNKLDRDRTLPEKKTKEIESYVGFANLPNQVYRKAVKKGFDFTLMVVGESGLGKSTLINSMFLADIYSADYPGPSQRIKKTVQVETSRTLLKENGVNLTLTIVDTPGFGDAVDNSNCWQPITDYIESRYEEYLNEESRVNRKSQTVDTRVHCCLYFIAPSGHGLKPLDVEFMQRLHDKVNIIPIIAKADTMTPEECNHFKKQILNEVAQHQIKIYDFPDEVLPPAAVGAASNGSGAGTVDRKLRERIPMAVVGSNTIVEVDGKKLRGRKYPWGVAEVENLEHCDFIALRNMLICTHLQDLKDVTDSVHYENYRCRKLAGLGHDSKQTRASNNSQTVINNTFMTVWNPLAQMEEEKREHDIKMKKMETEMEQVFEMKVKEKKQKLKDSEADLQRRHEQMKKSLELQIKELEEKRKALEAEKTAWEQTNGITIEELRRRSLERESVDGKEKKNKKKDLQKKYQAPKLRIIN
ncbi:septin-7 isoform X1 [Halyomorpha halys]|uniref:septin-7 isoform X1 n=1 Tax=Halyomorpha halys TaxID=286706 RepID=UPI0034D19517